MTSTSAFTCPKCSYRFRVKDKYLGQVAECPATGCAQKMRLNAPPVTAGAEAKASEAAAATSSALPSASQSDSLRPNRSGSSVHGAGDAVTEHPVVVDMSDGNQNSVISVTGMSPAESRRSQRAMRRRTTAAPPKVDVQRKPIDPTWIGFGAVIVIAVVGWSIWAFMSEPDQIDTKAPAAEQPLPIRVDGVDEQVSIPEIQPLFASLPASLLGVSSQQQTDARLKKKSCRT